MDSRELNSRPARTPRHAAARRAPRSDRCGAQQGFTLVEVLVTLVILGMLGAIVFGSLRQVFEARGRLRPYLDQSEQTALAADWFRQTVQGLIADYPEAKNRFAATADGFSGLSASPLAGPPGTPTPFHWALRYDDGQNLTVLEYGESSGTPMRIASWPGRRGAFAYYDTNEKEEQKWHADWPPAASAERAKEAIPQFPALIRLGGVPTDMFPTIVAAPRAAPFPRPLPMPAFRGF